jgi:hypothetical protein
MLAILELFRRPPAPTLPIRPCRTARPKLKAMGASARIPMRPGRKRPNRQGALPTTKARHARSPVKYVLERCAWRDPKTESLKSRAESRLPLGGNSRNPRPTPRANRTLAAIPMPDAAANAAAPAALLLEHGGMCCRLDTSGRICPQPAREARWRVFAAALSDSTRAALNASLRVCAGKIKHLSHLGAPASAQLPFFQHISPAAIRVFVDPNQGLQCWRT